MHHRVNVMPEGLRREIPSRGARSRFTRVLRVDIASRAITRRKTVLWRSVAVGGNEGGGEEGGG